MKKTVSIAPAQGKIRRTTEHVSRTHRTNPVTFETVRRLALALPGAEEGTSYGTPAFRVRGKLFARRRGAGLL